jgi:hypothetical protein
VAALTSGEHLAWAQQNEEAFKKFRAKWPDWAMTALFYAAVHEVQAFLIDNNHRPETHTARNRLVKQYWGPTIYPPYDTLQQRSRDARYNCIMPSEDDLNRAVLTLAKLRAAIAAERALMS